MMKTIPAMFALSASNMIGCVRPQRDNPPHRDHRQHRVINHANVAAAPRANARAARPENVSDRARHAFENVELRLEEYPNAEYRDHAAEDRAFLRRHCLGQRRCDSEPANVAARRHKRDVKQRRQRHAEYRAVK